MDKNIKVLLTILIIVLISTASFFFYYLVRNAITDLFNKLGIGNVYTQSITALILIIIVVIILTMVLGRKVNIFRTIKDILKT